MANETGLRTGSLAPLLGEWEFTTSVDGTVTSRGRTSFEWIEEGAFLRQAADGEPSEDAPPEWVANSPMPVTAIIGVDDTNDTATMLYADARGVRRVYQMTVTDGEWKVWRDAPGFDQRFTARFSADGKTITGGWETSIDGSTWQPDFAMTYTKVA